MDDREMKRLGIAVGAGLVGLAVLNFAYQAGFDAGLARGGNVVVGGPIDGHGFGFFPFPPLLLIVGVLFFVAWRRRWHGHGPGGHGWRPGAGAPPRLFEEWHRQAHGSEKVESVKPQTESTSEVRSTDRGDTRSTMV